MSDKQSIEKHQKYKSRYGKNELYWGIGIENEMYLTCSNKAEVSADFFRKNHKPERYSVDYYKSYKEKPLNRAIEDYIDKQKTLILPLLIIIVSLITNFIFSLSYAKSKTIHKNL